MNDDITPEMRNEENLARVEARSGEDAGTKGAEPDATVVEVAQELGTLLNNYVELLDRDDHGGWTWGDEAHVRSAVTMLDRAGRGINRRSILKSRIANSDPDTTHDSGNQRGARRLRGVRTTRLRSEASTEQTRWATDGGGNLERQAGP